MIHDNESIKFGLRFDNGQEPSDRTDGTRIRANTVVKSWH